MVRLTTLRQELFGRVLLRWTINSLGLWLAGVLFSGVSHGGDWGVILITALLLSTINAILKPIVVIMALPAILLSLGVFTIFVNGLMVYFAAKFVQGFEIDGYISAVLAGIVVSLLNYGLTTYLEERIIER